MGMRSWGKFTLHNVLYGDAGYISQCVVRECKDWEVYITHCFVGMRDWGSVHHTMCRIGMQGLGSLHCTMFCIWM